MGQSTNGKIDSSQKKSKTKIILISGIAVAVVIIAVLVGVIFKLMNKPAPAVTAPSEGRGTVANTDNIDNLRAEMAKPVEDGYYTVTMNNKWTFESSKTPSANAYVENSELNERTVYFDLILPDTEEVIYSSPYIPVGSELTGIALDSELPAGEHPAVVKYHLVDDDHNEITTVSVAVTLIIES